MIEKRASLEIIAPTVEEAIARGLEELGLPEENVDVEVLDSGSKGLFGIGSRQARIRLKIKSGAVEAEPPVTITPVPVPVMETVPVVETAPVQVNFIAAEESITTQHEEIQDENTLRVAQDTVRDLLLKMKVRAEVSAHYGEPDDEQSRVPVWVDVRGNDLSILIGPRTETLNALQYIASLIVGNEIGHSISMIVDVEGFRARRAQQLRQLARRMADQAIKTGRRQILEPMPASERRLIHIELRSNPQVTTESVGEEPRRKVTIIPR